MTPLISVLMPVRNGARWLREAVDSVLGQEFRDFELVVVDDGSDDGTPGVLERCSADDDRLRLLRQPPQGIVAALNLGIAAARGSYLARLDADDVARPDRLARQVAFIERHDRIDLVGSAAQLIDEGGTVIGRVAPPIDPAKLARHLRRGNPIVHSSVMMRADAVRRSGGYRKAFAAAEDYDLWLRMAERGGIANLPEPLVSLRRHGASVSRRNAVRQAFSVRLAQRSAAVRRTGADDPAAAFAQPPDWWAADAAAAFFAPEVGFYRFLDSDRDGRAAILSGKGAGGRRAPPVRSQSRRAQAGPGAARRDARGDRVVTSAPADRSTDRVAAPGTGARHGGACRHRAAALTAAGPIDDSR